MTDITAIYNGKKISQLPEDLFIPPEYLRIILEEFEGPLDLLLYLIKKLRIDNSDKFDKDYFIPDNLSQVFHEGCLKWQKGRLKVCLMQ